MDTLKTAAIESIKNLPNDCSVEDIMYRIHVIAQVLEGLEDAEAGKLITTEKLLEKVEEWGK